MPGTNPLFPAADQPSADAGYVLPKQTTKLQPVTPNFGAGTDAALNLIREKLARIYAEEPDPKAEERQAVTAKPKSEHQEFMYRLHESGKSLAEIQTAWHNYYVSLPDNEKREVWQEFYAVNETVVRQRAIAQADTQHYQPPQPSYHPTGLFVSKTGELPASDKRTTRQIRHAIHDKVSAGGRLKVKHHLQSLTFGLAVGFVTLVIFLFGLFNEIVIAPFIQPGNSVGATPIIIDPNAVSATATPEIIIPKINLEIPADFSQTSTSEADIENALENGIVHYPTTVMPGQIGNTAFFGHSSNNIFNPGKYKFAFVLLHELVPGDTFYITYQSKVYVYKVFSKQIVNPDDVSVLDNVAGHATTATLITCDPPGTSLHRLIVVGDQISPDPSGNSGGINTTPISTARELPDNGPSLLERIWQSIFG